MNHRAVVAALGALAVGATAILFVPTGALASVDGTTKARKGEIKLQETDGTCSVQATSRFQVMHGQPAQWAISNDCQDYTVEVANFRLGDQSVDPLSCTPAQHKTHVGQHGTGVITCPTHGNAATGVYSYVIKLNGKVVKDPELEILK